MFEQVTLALAGFAFSYLLFSLLAGRLMKDTEKHKTAFVAVSVFCCLQLIIRVQNDLDSGFTLVNSAFIFMLGFCALLYPSLRFIQKAKTA